MPEPNFDQGTANLLALFRQLAAQKAQRNDFSGIGRGLAQAGQNIAGNIRFGANQAFQGEQARLGRESREKIAGARADERERARQEREAAAKQGQITNLQEAWARVLDGVAAGKIPPGSNQEKFLLNQAKRLGITLQEARPTPEDITSETAQAVEQFVKAAPTEQGPVGPFPFLNISEPEDIRKLEERAQAIRSAPKVQSSIGPLEPDSAAAAVPIERELARRRADLIKAQPESTDGLPPRPGGQPRVSVGQRKSIIKRVANDPGIRALMMGREASAKNPNFALFEDIVREIRAGTSTLDEIKQDALDSIRSDDVAALFPGVAERFQGGRRLPTPFFTSGAERLIDPKTKREFSREEVEEIERRLGGSIVTRTERNLLQQAGVLPQPRRPGQAAFVQLDRSGAIRSDPLLAPEVVFDFIDFVASRVRGPR